MHFGILSFCDYVFENCIGIKIATIPCDIKTNGKAIFSIFNNLKIINNSNGSISICLLDTTVKLNTVVTIESNAFANCCGISSINILRSLKSIKEILLML